VRDYGSRGPSLVLLHGGPGVAGYLAALAVGLAASFRVLEPLQRGSGEARLTVARHVADLHAVLQARCRGQRVALVGHSWGAMLALAYAAAHPDPQRPIVLVACGTFDVRSRNRLREILEQRTDAALRGRLERVGARVADPDARLLKLGALSLPLYSYDLLSSALEVDTCDARAHEQSWSDMLRLQEQGIYPAAFAGIEAPVLMLHGAWDPHPGALIRASLEPHLSRLEYREWERCGHYPWLERHVRQEFLDVLQAWLAQKIGSGGSREDSPAANGSP